MKKIGFVLLMASGPVLASSSGVNSGASLTSGPGVNHHSLFGASNNPAMAPLVIDEDEKWRFNYLPSFAINAEVGSVDNFADDIDELIDIIDDPSSTTDSATEVLDRFNDVLVRMGESGYLKTSSTVRAPLLPFYFRPSNFSGTFSADYSANLQVGLRVIDAPLALDPQTQNFISDTSVYLKSGIEHKFSFGYAQRIFPDKFDFEDGGRIYAGVMLNYYSIELSKQIIRIQDLNGDEIEDVVEDEYDNNLLSNSNVGIDIGVVLDAPRYRAGLTFENINSPSFSYGDIGINCEERGEYSFERNSCEISRVFVSQGRLKSSEDHVKHAVLRADAMYKLTNRWSLNSSFDLAKYDDLVGFENQWLNLSTSYEAKGWILPSARIGYQQNLAGSNLSTYTFGLTLFKAIDLDFEWSTESVDVDGDTAPRRVGFSIAFEERF